MIRIKGNETKNIMNISTDEADFGEFDTSSCIEAIETLHAEYPGMIEVDTVSTNWRVVSKAAELAGLSEYQLSKITSTTGKVVC